MGRAGPSGSENSASSPASTSSRSLRGTDTEADLVWRLISHSMSCNNKGVLKENDDGGHRRSFGEPGCLDAYLRHGGTQEIVNEIRTQGT